MAEHRENCKISGIGNPTTRLNEITADDLAVLRNYQVSWDYGVIDRQGYKFDINYALNTSSIEVGKGIMFAYGYVGYVDNSVFEFIRPAIPQYHIIYVELDRSKIPNTCTIKVKNNQSSTSIERTFRQDYLDKVRTGIFQLPLWRVKVGANGIEEVFDLREDLDLLKQSIKQVEYAPNCKSVFGSIDETVTATTQPVTDNSKKIATTDFVHLATMAYIGSSKEIQVTICGELSEYDGVSHLELLTQETLKEGDILFYNGESAEILSKDDEGIYTIIAIENGEFYKKQHQSIMVTVILI